MSCTSFDQRVGPLGLGVLRQDRRDELANGGALVARHAGQLVQAHQLNHAIGIERSAATQALHLGQRARAIQRHDVVEGARLAEDHEGPGNLRLRTGPCLLERRQQRVAPRLAHGPAVLRQRQRGHALNRLRRHAQGVDRELHAFRIFGPRELLEGFGANLFARFN